QVDAPVGPGPFEAARNQTVDPAALVLGLVMPWAQAVEVVDEGGAALGPRNAMVDLAAVSRDRATAGTLARPVSGPYERDLSGRGITVGPSVRTGRDVGVAALHGSERRPD